MHARTARNQNALGNKGTIKKCTFSWSSLRAFFSSSTIVNRSL